MYILKIQQLTPIFLKKIIAYLNHNIFKIQWGKNVLKKVFSWDATDPSDGSTNVPHDKHLTKPWPRRKHKRWAGAPGRPQATWPRAQEEQRPRRGGLCPPPRAGGNQTTSCSPNAHTLLPAWD